MSFSLLLQQCLICMVCLIVIVFVMGGRRAAALWGTVQDLFNIACSILV